MSATLPPTGTAQPYVFDATTTTFEAEVLHKSMQVPVLVDFWAAWCGPCKQLGPILEKLAAEYNGAFELAKVDVDNEQPLAAAFQVRSIPTVMLVKDGQLVDGFPGALPETQLREFLKQHGIEPAIAIDMPAGAMPATVEPEVAPTDPHAEAIGLRKALAAAPDKAEIKLDLALALLAADATHNSAEAGRLLDALPANLATDERTVKARARLGFAALLADAPPMPNLQAALAADPDDLRARYLLGVQQLLAGDARGGLDQFLEMLRRNRDFDDGLPRKALIDAFRILDDQALVGDYRRRMSSLLLI